MIDTKKSVHISVKKDEINTIEELDKMLDLMKISRSEFFTFSAKLFIDKNRSLYSKLEELLV
jgi:hypothetical protein